MREMLFSLIGITLLQSLLLLIAKDDWQRKVLNLIAGTAMASVLIAGITGFDYRTYASSLQQEKTEIAWDVDQVKKDADSLRRRYIESECKEYILESASQMRIELTDVQVALDWNTEGFWYPVHAELRVKNQNVDFQPKKQFSIFIWILERMIGFLGLMQVQLQHLQITIKSNIRLFLLFQMLPLYFYHVFF